MAPTYFLEAVDRRNVGMVQRGEGSRLALEPRQMARVVNECLGQELQRDVAAKLGVRGLKDVSHASRSEVADDRELSERCADHHAAIIYGLRDAF